MSSESDATERRRIAGRSGRGPGSRGKLPARAGSREDRGEHAYGRQGQLPVVESDSRRYDSSSTGEQACTAGEVGRVGGRSGAHKKEV